MNNKTPRNKLRLSRETLFLLDDELRHASGGYRQTKLTRCECGYSVRVSTCLDLCDSDIDPYCNLNTKGQCPTLVL